VSLHDVSVAFSGIDWKIHILSSECRINVPFEPMKRRDYVLHYGRVINTVDVIL